MAFSQLYHIYNDIISRSRNRVGVVQSKLLEAQAKELATILVGLYTEWKDTTYPMDSERAGQMIQSIRRKLLSYGLSVEDKVIASATASAKLAAQAHASAMTAVFKAVGSDLPVSSFADVPAHAIEMMLARRGLAEKYGVKGFSGLFRSITERNLQNYALGFDQYLTKMVGTGMSPAQATRDIAAFLSIGDPSLGVAMKKLGLKGGFVKGTSAETIAFMEKTGDLGRARNILYDARRISITEIALAHDEADKLSSVRSTVVQALKWNTSGAHSGMRTSPDACDIARDADRFGLGPGVYPPEYVPALLHPHCQCYTSKILRDPAKWGTPKDAPIEPLPLKKSDVSKIMLANRTQWSRGQTPAFIDLQKKLVNSKQYYATKYAGLVQAAASGAQVSQVKKALDDDIDQPVTHVPEPEAPPKPVEIPEKVPEPEPLKLKSHDDEAVAFPKSLDDLTEVRQLGGSTGAKLMRDEDGYLWVMKQGATEEHLIEEMFTDKIYRAMGVNVPEFKAYKGAGGRATKLARHIEGEELGKWIETASNSSDIPAGLRKSKVLQTLRKDFVADALTLNWDVIGLDADNILIGKTGRVWRIDNGSGFRFRAMGSRKPESALVAEVSELLSMRGKMPGISNPSATKYFGQVTDKQIQTQIKKFLRREKAILAATPEELRPIMEARLNYLRSQIAPPKPKLSAGQRPGTGAIFAEEVTEKARRGISGSSTLFDKGDIEDLEGLLWTERMTNGKPMTAFRFKMTREGSRKLDDYLSATNSDAIASTFDEDKVFHAILDAAKNVNYHIDSGSFQFNAAKLAAMHDAQDYMTAAVLAGKIEQSSVANYQEWMRLIRETVSRGKNAEKLPFTVTRQGVRVKTDIVKVADGKFEANKVAPKWNVKAYDPANPGVATNTSSTTFDWYLSKRWEYEIDVDGVRVRYRPFDDNLNSTDAFTQQGWVRFEVPGDATAETVAKIERAMQKLGIDTSPASEEYMEALYLLKGINLDRDTFKGTVRGEAIRVINDADLPDADKVTKLKEIIRGQGVKIKVDTKEAARGFFGKADGTNYRHWKRWDITEAEVEDAMKGFILHHESGSSPADLLEWLLSQGGDFTPTAERLRKGIMIDRGTANSGMSPNTDFNYGTANYLFTRLKQGERSGWNFKIRLLARMDAQSYNGDWAGGSLSSGRTNLGNAAVREASKVHPPGWVQNSAFSMNETLFKNGISVLEDVESIVTASEELRQRILAVFRKYGITRLPDGRKIEEVVKLKRLPGT